MNIGFMIFIFVANWAFKLFIAFLAYSLVTWLGAPMWVVIAVTAVAAVETKFVWDLS